MCLSPLQLLLLGLYLNVIDVHWTVLGVRDSNNGLDFICSLDFFLDFQLALVDMYELLKEIILFFSSGCLGHGSTDPRRLSI